MGPYLSPTETGVSTKRGHNKLVETLEEAYSLLDGFGTRDSSEAPHKTNFWSSAIPEDLCQFISESSLNLRAETTPQHKLDNHIPCSDKKYQSSVFQHLFP